MSAHPPHPHMLMIPDCLKTLRAALLLAALLLWPALPADAQSGPQIVEAAKKQIGVTLEYDPTYRKLSYPGGDVPLHTGVCTDVVVRALRNNGIDLQQAVHEDMKRHFKAYPQNWGLQHPDRNIDHRRVPNLMRYFERQHIALREKLKAVESYRPGDIVAWDLGGGILHIGIVSDNTKGSTPLIIHNIGSGTREEDILMAYTIIGHYRVKPAPDQQDQAKQR